MTARLERLTGTVAPATVTIMGTISDPSGYPLAGITIVLFEDGRDEGTRFGTATTDDVGGYRFARVRAMAGDDYRVEATDDSGAHVSTCASFKIGPDITTMHHATMPIAGYIQGKVTTQNGTAPAQPGRHVCVTAAGETTVQAVYISVNGKFRLGGLPAGKYALAFHDSDLAFADQCYSNVRIDDDACAGSTKVTVTAGDTTTIEDQVLNHPTNVLDGIEVALPKN
jgi:hypothetical protein